MKHLALFPAAAALLLTACGPTPQQRFHTDLAGFHFTDLAIASASLDVQEKPPTAQIRFIANNPKSNQDGAEMGQVIAKLYTDKDLKLGDSTYTYAVSKGGVPLDIFTFKVHGKEILAHIHNGTLDQLNFQKNNDVVEVTNMNLINALAVGLNGN